MKKLPVGIQTFAELIGEGYLYIDKTGDIYDLMQRGGKYYFLSRPRRFGKSLLVSTLKEIFSGNRELFKGLWIYDRIDWAKYPVLAIDFTRVSYKTPEVFEQSLKRFLDDLAGDHGLRLDREKDYKESFLELIKKMSRKGRVVILVDEYDKPIIDRIEQKDIAGKNREILQEFYSVIKSADELIEFAFLTGVSKFSRVSVFSGLNNLDDITLDDAFATILGYTEEELQSYFDRRIETMAGRLDTSKADLIRKIRQWYNGYSWDGEHFVYNPLSILKLFAREEFDNYWFSTGTPAFLVKTIRSGGMSIDRYENIEVDSAVFDSYDVDHIESTSLLFQAGYLTVKKKMTVQDGKLYELSYPNKEVRDSFFKFLLKSFTDKEFAENLQVLRELKEALWAHRLDRFFDVVKSLFASIPYNMVVNNREGYYQTVMYLLLKLVGVDIRGEVETNIGRIDSVIEVKDRVYIVEFKMGSEKEALAQIKDKAYHEKFLSSGKEIVLLGVGFDVEKRNIGGYVTETIHPPG
jgi:hypothetical protein